jgi:hypothetical protein
MKKMGILRVWNSRIPGVCPVTDGEITNLLGFAISELID